MSSQEAGLQESENDSGNLLPNSPPNGKAIEALKSYRRRPHSNYLSAYIAQVEALFRKHALTIINTPFLMLLSLIFPLVTVTLTATVFNAITATAFGEVPNTEPLPLRLSDCSGQLVDCATRVYFQPDDPYHQRLMERFIELSGLPDTAIVPFPDADTMHRAIIANGRSNNRRILFAGVDFNTFASDPPSSFEEGQERLGNNPVSAYTIVGPSSLVSDGLFPPIYAITNGKLMAVKQYIDMAIISLRKQFQSGELVDPEFTAQFQSFRFVAKDAEEQLTEDRRISRFARRGINRGANLLTTTLLTISWYPQVLLLVNILGYDKHRGLFGPLRKMGMKEGAYWMSVLLLVVLKSLVGSAISLIGFLTTRGSFYVYEAIGVDVFFLSMWVFGVALSFFSFIMVSASVRQYATTILIIALLLLVALLQFIPILIPVEVTSGAPNAWWGFWTYPLYSSIWLFLMPWFHYAKIVQDFLEAGETSLSEPAAVLYDLSQAGSFKGPFTVDGPVVPSTVASLGHLVLFTIVLFFVNWYLNQVFTGFPGVLRRLPFPLYPSYWGMPKRGVRVDTSRQKASLANQSVIVSDLSKTFGTFRAVDHVSMTIDKGQVIALLGHNGAGKSSLINMLSGLIPPSEGEAYVFGLSVCREMPKIQEDLGVCPQDDFLWERLSAFEHIRLYARFKNIPLMSLTSYVNNRLAIVGLRKHASRPVGLFSGGMKRRVSILLASIGNPRFMILDEPTTGMDPINRRRVWEFLQVLKQDASMLLTTHSMEEADVLGDQVVIMDHGGVKAAGTSLALKNQYGKGYQLNLLTRPAMQGDVENLVKQMVPNTELVASGSGSLTVAVPIASVSHLPAFFRYVTAAEAENKRAGHPALIREWGVQNTSLEQVFIRLAGSATQIDRGVGRQHAKKNHAEDTDDHVPDAALKLPDFRSNVKFTTALRAIILKNVTFQLKQIATNIVLLLVIVVCVVGIHVLVPIITQNREICDDGRTASATRSFATSSCDMAVLAQDLTERSRLCNTRPQGQLSCTGLDFSVGKYTNLVKFDGPRVWYNEGGKVKDSLLRQAEAVVQLSNIILDSVQSRFQDGIKNVVLEPLTLTPSPDPSVDIQSLVTRNQETFRDDAERILTCPGDVGFLASSHDEAEDLYRSRFPDAGFELITSDVDSLKLNFRVTYWPPADVDRFRSRFVRVYFPGTGRNQNVCIWVGLTEYSAPGSVALQVSQQGSPPKDASFRIMQQSMINAFARQALGDRERLLVNYVDTEIAGPTISLFAASVLLLSAMFYLFPIFTVGPYSDRDESLFGYLRVNGVSIWAYWLGYYLFDILLSLPAIVITFVGVFTYFPYINAGIFLVSSVVVVHTIIGMAFLLVVMLPSSAISKLLSYVVPFFFAVVGSLVVYTDILNARPEITLFHVLLPPVAYAYAVRLILEAETDPTPYVAIIASMLVVGLVLIFGAIGLAQAFQGPLKALLNDPCNTLQRALRRSRDGVSEKSSASLEEAETDDEDVKAHSKLVRSAVGTVVSRRGLVTGSGTFAVQTDALTKKFGRTPIVKELTLGVQEGEVFGLLGPNGAGKTTTLNMLMGQLKATSGSATVGGYSIDNTGLSNVLGVCPQFDRVFRELTVEENLLFFARVRGASGKKARGLAAKAARMVGLGKQTYSRRAENLSGGMRRRLSIAIALLALPTVVFLDEPSTGLDPSNRIHVWNIIAAVKERKDVAMIITTHLMEEADALCERVGIMAGGKLRCIGSQVHLKNKFGNGYQLTIQARVYHPLNETSPSNQRKSISLLNRSPSEFLTLGRVTQAIPLARAIQAEEATLHAIESFVLTKVCPGARTQFQVTESGVRKRLAQVVLDASQDYGTWCLPNVHFFLPPDVDLADVFDSLSTYGQQLNIVEWGLNQSTLEDVFIKVAGPYVE